MEAITVEESDVYSSLEKEKLYGNQAIQAMCSRGHIGGKQFMP